MVPTLPPGMAPLAAMFARAHPQAQMPAAMGGDARGLGILNLLQQRQPALLSRLRVHSPQMLGAGATPPAFGMASFPHRGASSY